MKILKNGWIPVWMCFLFLLSLQLHCAASADSERAYDGGRSPEERAWTELNTLREEDGQGNVFFSVNLSEEQMALFDSASLLIMERLGSEESLGDTCLSLWKTGKLEPDDNGRIAAPWTDRAIYLVDDESGDVIAGPVDYLVGRDGRMNVFVTYYGDLGIVDESKLTFKYVYSFENTTLKREPDGVYAYEKETDSYSAEVDNPGALISERKLTTGSVYLPDRLMPRQKEGLPGYTTWPIDDSSAMRYSFSLPCEWHLEVRENVIPMDRVYATFQIADQGGRQHSSSLCRVDPKSFRELEVIPELDKGSLLKVDVVSAGVYEESAFIAIELDLDDPAENLLGFDATHFILNHSCQAETMRTSVRNKNRLILTIPKAMLLGKPALSTVEFDVEPVLTDYSRGDAEHVILTFPKPPADSWGDEASLAHFDDGSLSWDLLKVSQDVNRIHILYSAEEKRRAKTAVRLVGLAVEGYYEEQFTEFRLPKKQALIRKDIIYTRKTMSDESYAIRMKLEDALCSLGVSEIRNICFYYYLNDEKEIRTAQFRLAEAKPCQERPDAGDNNSMTLLNQDGIRIRLEQTVEYRDDKTEKNIAALGLWVSNESDEDRTIYLDSYRCNGKRALNRFLLGETEYLLPKGTSRYIYLKMETEIPLEELREVQFTAYIRGLFEVRNTVALKLPTEDRGP